MNQAASLTRTLIGRVVSDKMQKTVTVLVERKIQHPVYGKQILQSKKYHVHVDQDGIGMGDTVEIAETRPISKTKAWAVTKLISKAIIV